MIDISDIQVDIENSEHRIRALQSETVHCIAILPTGKIQVVDKGKLEELNSEVERLMGLIEHNNNIHETLSELLNGADCLKNLRGGKNRVLEPTVQLARDRKRQVEAAIADIENLFRIDMGNLIKHTYDIDPANPFEHPKAKDLRETADIRLASLHSELSTVEDLLTRAEAILQDFQPSGLPPQRAEQHHGLISREKVGGMA